MKILLVANDPLDRQTSMLRFAAVLERGLRARGHAVTTLAPRAVLLPAVTRRDGARKWLGYANKFVAFPRELRAHAREFDVVHVCDHSNAPYVPALAGQAHVVTCHDVLAIRAARGLDDVWRVGATGRAFQRLILAGLARAQHVACVSEFTRGQLLELAPGLADRVSLVGNGLPYPFAPLSAADCAPHLATLGITGPYFLHVGSALARKNRAHAVRVLAALLRRRPELPHRLVFAGEPLGADVQPVAAELGIGERVVAAGAVDDERLRALYSAATALFFPSLSEGFGWPVIEAQACACPALVSDLEPMRTIGGGGAIAFDPHDAEAAAATVAEALPRLESLRRAALENAARFTTEAMLAGYERAYARVRAERPNARVRSAIADA